MKQFRGVSCVHVVLLYDDGFQAEKYRMPLQMERVYLYLFIELELQWRQGATLF